MKPLEIGKEDDGQMHNNDDVNTINQLQTHDLKPINQPQTHNRERTPDAENAGANDCFAESNPT